MFKKVIIERTLHYNKILRNAHDKMKLYEHDAVTVQICQNVIMQAEACLAELIIIQNKLTLIKFLTK
jgi:hypothetical protein